MSTPYYFVEVGFQQTTDFATPFLLDSDLFGYLNTDRLGGIQMVDLTDQAQAISITRGRNRDTEQFNAGTAQVRFRDPDRLLDPLNQDSPYYPWVQPLQPITITASNFPDRAKAVPIFTGVITDWDLDYDYTTPGNVVTARCADAFTTFANMVMNQWTPSAELSGNRVLSVLERPEVAYQGPYSIGTTYSALGAFQIDAGTNVLSYLQNVMTSEQGYLFMSADGALTFIGRNNRNQPVSASGLNFTEDGTGIRYRTLVSQFGDELLYNYIQFQSPAGAVQTATDSNSAALYQARQYSKLDLLNSTTTEVEGLADLFLGQHKDPLLRFTSVNVLVNDVDVSVRQELLGLDITDVVGVQKSYDVGSPASVQKYLLVSGIEHQITPGNHVIRYTFENIEQNAQFQLDSDTYGYLDVNVLGLV